MPFLLLFFSSLLAGRVLVRADVMEIVVANGRTTGVRLRSGEEIHAPLVVSSTGFLNTFGQLLPETVTTQFNIPRTLDPSVTSSAGFVLVNVGMKGTAAELGVSCANHWYLPMRKGNMFAAVQEHWKDPLGDADNIPMMFTWPSLKDRAWVAKHPDRHTCQILVMAETLPYRRFSSGSTDAAYLALKQKWQVWTQFLLHTLHIYFSVTIFLTWRCPFFFFSVGCV
jgi:hypothetical protein